MKRSLLLSGLIAALLSGCALFPPTPQNAGEYRAAISDNPSIGTVDTYRVNRPYATVVKVIKQKTKQCLAKKVIEEHCTSTTSTTNCNENSFDFKPTFIQSQNKTELHVQMNQSNALFPGGAPPASGMYITVVDVTPVDKKTTQLKVYSPTEYFKAVPNAVKHWANGTNLGCPDYSQDI